MKPKITLLDIETFPNIGATWGVWEQNVVWVEKQWEIASIAFKELGSNSIEVISQKTMSHKRLMKKIHQIMNSSDIVIAHNGDNFDIKKIRTRLITTGHTPPSPFKTVDTKKISKSQFGFNSNSLADLCEELGLGKKLDTGGKELWRSCMAGDGKAWDKMERYNKHDVVLLERLYKKFRAWAPTHPSLATYSPNSACPKCGSNHFQSRGHTVVRKKLARQYQCQNCGGWFT